MTSHLSHLQRPWAGKDHLSSTGEVSEAGRASRTFPMSPPPGVDPSLVPLLFLPSLPSSYQCAAGPWENCLGRSSCDMGQSMALEAMVTLASQKLWDLVAAWKWPGPSVSSPKLAVTSKEAWLSSVTRAVTPTHKGSPCPGESEAPVGRLDQSLELNPEQVSAAGDKSL